MQKHVRRAATACLLLLFWLAAGTMAQAAPLTEKTQRMSGPTRIDTAISVSQNGWQTSDNVVLVRSDDFPDALVAVPLAYRLGAPILLTNPGSLDPRALSEIKRLQAKHVVLLGSTKALSQAIADTLTKAGLSVERIGGSDRYATAALVADKLGSSGQVILASGENFPDALAAGPYAAVTGTPILLTGAKALPSATGAELAKLGAAQTLVLGSQAAIADAVITGLPNVNRIGGSDRYETAAKFDLFAQDKLPGAPAGSQAAPQAYLVTGEDFPDGLVAGALAARQNAPIFLTATASLPAVSYSVMGNAAERNMVVNLIGSTAAISAQVQSVVEGVVQPSYLLAGSTIVVDSGHGGPDPGAMGPSGTLEKNNTLAIGLNLADLLRKAGATVVMTRSSDTPPTGAGYSELPDLQARVKLANDAKANLFVSIHNNSYTSQSAAGTETYYSSKNPVSSQSQRLGKNIQAELAQQLGLDSLHDRGVKDAPFYVIKNTVMPAVLVEVGFISNPTEEQLLASAAYRSSAALGIYRGILVFEGY